MVYLVFILMLYGCYSVRSGSVVAGSFGDSSVSDVVLKDDNEFYVRLGAISCSYWGVFGSVIFPNSNHYTISYNWGEDGNPKFKKIILDSSDVNLLRKPNHSMLIIFRDSNDIEVVCGEESKMIEMVRQLEKQEVARKRSVHAF